MVFPLLNLYPYLLLVIIRLRGFRSIGNNRKECVVLYMLYSIGTYASYFELASNVIFCNTIKVFN